MNRIVTQSLFSSEAVAARSWQSYVTSIIVHVLTLVLLLSITVPAVQQAIKPAQHVTLIAPQVPAYKPKVLPQPVIHTPISKNVFVPSRKLITPPLVKPAEPKPQTHHLANAPELKPVTPLVAHNIPEAKIEAPAPPKPEIRTGVFGGEEQAKGNRQQHDLKVGGFGDPNGVPAANAPPSQVQMAKLGGFDMPDGEGKAGGGGQARSGAVRTSGFGDSTTNSPGGGTGSKGSVKTGGFGSGDPNGVPGGTGRAGRVKTGGFGESAPAAPAQSAQIHPAQSPTTPVEILFKPKPAYTDEAKQMRLEGQVSLEVVFLAAGGVKVVRIVRGLGHGLDEAAEQAAAQVRFRPATRSGVPVDTNATIYITFQLS